MLIVNKLIPQGRGLAPVLVRRARTVTLDWSTRRNPEATLPDTDGRALQLRLPAATVLRGGDVLVAEDGSFVRVEAAAEPVLQVRHCPHHGTPQDLLHAAWLLGGLHVPMAVADDHLRIAPNDEVAGLLRRAHLIVTEARAPFEPQGGAGHGAHGHGHHEHAHHAHDHHEHGHHGHDHHGHDAHGHDAHSAPAGHEPHP